MYCFSGQGFSFPVIDGYMGQVMRKRLKPYAGADQPAHHSLISTFVVRSLDSIIYLVSRSEISRF